MRQRYQGAGIVVRQPDNLHFGKPGQLRNTSLVVSCPCRKDHAHRFGSQASRREPEHLRRCPVQPLRVIDRQQQGARLCDFGKQSEHRQVFVPPVQRRV
jgi:hypothetical protein